ncbi:hypothetical protein [Sphingomonas sp.]|uniref:hypothetical protein n=1 Tax=Sphingomonas sp. TaxID=28214 RepID=UPI001D9BDFAE|nr:hypothetical protein [Sphingomonas sp.]MBX9795289.1 hypothetical protein [Sphingomonas sp.]
MELFVVVVVAALASLILVSVALALIGNQRRRARKRRRHARRQADLWFWSKFVQRSKYKLLTDQRPRTEQGLNRP